GRGGTPVRYIVLSSATAMFVLTAVLLRTSSRPPLFLFIHWYSLALLLLAVALFGLMIETSRNSVLDWMCRAAQYLSGIYMFVAALASRQESGAPDLALGRAFGVARHRYGVAAMAVLCAAAVRLVFLPGLGTRA